MIPIRILPLLLPILFFIFSSSSSSRVLGDDVFQPASTNQSEGNLSSSPFPNYNEDANRSTILLAAAQTHRKDPLNKLHYYTGGWDYRNMHYWASVAFSGAPLVIIAVLWFVGLGLFLLFICCCCCCYCLCCRTKATRYSKTCYILSRVLLALFTIGIIVGCAYMFKNEESFNQTVISTIQYLVQKGLSIFHNLMNIVNALDSAKDASLNQVHLPPEISSHIDSVDQMVKYVANLPQLQSSNIGQAIRALFDPVRLALIILVSVMLTMTILGLICSFTGIQCIVFIMAIVGWIFVTALLLLSSFFLVFHNVIADTCVAVDDWVQNPMANSPLDLSFLPCLDNRTTQETVQVTRESTFFLIDNVNNFIKETANKDLPPDLGPLYQRHSGPLVPLLCSPLNPDLTNRTCAPGEVNFTEAAPEWSKYVCQVSADGLCTTPGRFSPLVYDQMMASVNISYSLYSFGPFLEEVGDCSIVVESFRDISRNYCPNLRKYSYGTFVGLLVVTLSAMCSVVLWMSYAREKSHKRSAKKGKRESDQSPFIGYKIG